MNDDLDLLVGRAIGTPVPPSAAVLERARARAGLATAPDADLTLLALRRVPSRTGRRRGRLAMGVAAGVAASLVGAAALVAPHGRGLQASLVPGPELAQALPAEPAAGAAPTLLVANAADWYAEIDSRTASGALVRSRTWQARRDDAGRSECFGACTVPHVSTGYVAVHHPFSRMLFYADLLMLPDSEAGMAAYVRREAGADPDGGVAFAGLADLLPAPSTAAQRWAELTVLARVKGVTQSTGTDPRGRSATIFTWRGPGGRSARLLADVAAAQELAWQTVKGPIGRVASTKSGPVARLGGTDTGPTGLPSSYSVTPVTLVYVTYGPVAGNTSALTPFAS